MTRSIALALALAAGALPTVAAAPHAPVAAPAGSPSMNPFQELFDLSMKEKKGLLFHVGSQSIGGVVVKVGEGTVEVKNREYGRIIIRLDRIDAVAMN